jgi:hypothetical protein
MTDTLNDGVMSKLSQFSGTANDKQVQALRSLISAGVAGSALNDLWLQYCTQEGFTQGTTQERIKALMLSSLGAFPSSNYNDIQRAFWNSASTPINPTEFFFDFDTGPLTNLPANMLALNFVYTRTGTKYVLQDLGAGLLLVQLAQNQFGNSYDGVGGRYAYWAEKAVQNLFGFTQAFDNAYWAKTNTTITPNSVISPDTSLTADTIVESVDGGAAQHFVAKNMATAGTRQTFSAYIKAAGRSRVQLLFGSANPIFDLISGTLFSNPSGLGTPAIEYAGNNWWRCSITQTPTATAARFIIVEGTQTSYQGDGRGALYIWGAQLEGSPAASSYIPALDATLVTRGADFLGCALSNFTGFSAAQYTLASHARQIARIAGTERVSISVDGGGPSNLAQIEVSTTDNTRTFVVSSGTPQSDVSDAPPATTTPTGLALSCAAASFLSGLNGASRTADLSGLMPVGPTFLAIGCDPSSAVQYNGYIYDAAFYTVAKTQSEVDAISSL